ncbi:hypothetical protein EAF00_009944 [Botryotinia globosa]|nr:hypothetical protein EAF00_009944 [Botryotinia globosa]
MTTSSAVIPPSPFVPSNSPNSKNSLASKPGPTTLAPPPSQHLMTQELTQTLSLLPHHRPFNSFDKSTTVLLNPNATSFPMKPPQETLRDCRTTSDPSQLSKVKFNFKCTSHNKFFEVNMYQKDPMNVHHWRANIARPAGDIDL